MFYANLPAYPIAEMISSGKYKLKYVGYSLVLEFVMNITIDGDNSRSIIHPDGFKIRNIRLIS